VIRSTLIPEREYFAACTLGLERVLQQELTNLGAHRLELRAGGVGFHADLRTAYSANLWLRCAVRVQELVLKVDLNRERDLYPAIAAIDWDQYLTTHHTLAIDASVKDSCIRHSGYAAMRTKDAIVDQQRRKIGRRSSVDTGSPHLRLKLVLRNDRLLLYRDYSGESLHKRGYRKIQVKSPLNEAIAAGLLLHSDFDGRSFLVDPMCGSGTFLIEAALIATDRAPGWMRHFAFEKWPDFEGALWDRLREEATARIRHDVPLLLEGADRHRGAIEIARAAAQSAGVDSCMLLHCKDIRSFVPTRKPQIVVVNPPYGERIGAGEDLLDSWNGLLEFLKGCAAGVRVGVLSGDPKLSACLDLPAARQTQVMNGPIKCQWIEARLGAGLRSRPDEASVSASAEPAIQPPSIPEDG